MRYHMSTPPSLGLSVSVNVKDIDSPHQARLGACEFAVAFGSFFRHATWDNEHGDKFYINADGVVEEIVSEEPHA